MRALCRAIVRASALLAPRRARLRWREEWLAEVAAARSGRVRLVARVCGAPLDAALYRWTGGFEPGTRSGWTADLRDAWRALYKTPLQTATMIGCLAIGAALMVAAFAAGNALVAGEQPGIRDRSSLFFLERRETGGMRTSPFTIGHFAAIDWNNLAAPVLSAGGEMRTAFDAVIDGLPHRVRGSLVTGRFFEALGTVPHVGRLIARADDAPSAPGVAVIGYSLWQRAFAGRPDVVGRPVQIGSRTVDIIGVAPAGFVGTEIGDLGRGPDEDEEIWMLLRADSFRAHGKGYLSGIGPRMVIRVAPGTTRDSIEAGLGSLVPVLQAHDSRPRTTAVAALPFRFAELEEEENGLTVFFAILLFIPTVVLLIGGANVASVQAARAAWRVHELAVRVSLGASRLRLARLLALETLIVAIASAGLAWMLATAALEYSSTLLPFVTTPDWRVLLFSLGLPILITLTIGILPSWRASGFDVVSGLRLGLRSGAATFRRSQRRVVGFQIAVSIALVLTSLVLARAIATGPMGAGRANADVLVAGFYLSTVPETDRRPAIRALMSELSTMAAPEDIAFATGEVRWSGTAYIGEGKPDPRSRNWADARYATPSIFGLLNVLLVQGRSFADRERGVMVVNETFVKQFGMGRPVIGSSYRVVPAGMLVTNAKGEWVDSTGEHLAAPMTIVGVVTNGFERDARGRPKSKVYLPFDVSQRQAFSVFMRPANIAEAERKIRELAARVAPVRAPAPLGTIAELTDDQFRGHRWVSRAFGYTGYVALFLAAVGLFGLVSTTVAQRRHEFAVRVALGADRRGIIAHVAGDLARLAAIGLAVGFLLAVPAWYIIRDEVAAHATMLDPQILVTVIASLCMAAAAAGFLPARRAGAADPLAALRGD